MKENSPTILKLLNQKIKSKAQRDLTEQAICFEHKYLGSIPCTPYVSRACPSRLILKCRDINKLCTLSLYLERKMTNKRWSYLFILLLIYYLTNNITNYFSFDT